MAIIAFPLLLIPLAVCNIVVFLMPGLGFDAALYRLALPSGAAWTIQLGDVIVASTALLLLFEVMKAGRPGGKYAIDHLLSLLVLGGTAAEFVMLPQFGNVTMFLLSVLALVDFLGGIALRSRVQRVARDRRTVSAAAEPVELAAPAVPDAEASSSTSSASASAASIAEAVLLDPPQPVSVSASTDASPRIVSPGLQPAAESAATAHQSR